jgi:hypothetical protein
MSKHAKKWYIEEDSKHYPFGVVYASLYPFCNSIFDLSADKRQLNVVNTIE